MARGPWRCLSLSGALALCLLLAGCGGGGDVPGVADPTPSDSAPQNVAAVAGDRRVTISWSPVDRASSYNLYWSNSPGVSKTAGARLAGVSSPFVHDGLSWQMSYFYVVTAVVDGREGPESAEVYATPPWVPPPPGLVLAYPGRGAVTLMWDVAIGTDSYNIYWSLSAGVTKLTGARIDNVQSPYVHRELAGGTTYHYVVTSVGMISGWEGDESAEVSATTLPFIPDATDVGQYFDRAIQAPGPANYADNASHPLRGLTTADSPLLFGAQGSENCLGCHYASGPARTSDECLKCHFENQGFGATPGALDPARHMNGRVELATVSGNLLATSQFAVASIPDYDAWCLQCHRPGATTGLGGVTPSGKTVVDDAAIANSRHRAVASVGCIYCHHPHGTMNTRLVRNNPTNRWNAGATPLTFGVFPGDNTGIYGGSVYPPNQNVAYRSRVDANFADAGDENNYCNRACHDPSKPNDSVVVRDNTTGIYLLTAGGRKQYLVSGALYTWDNSYLAPYWHAHTNNEIIPTDNIVQLFANQSGQTGPSFYHYPGGSSSDPATFGPAQNLLSPLPFFPDFPDGDRDFSNGYLDKGPIRYRYTCSSCHNPHGTNLANTPGSTGWPDLRLPKRAPYQLCLQCH